MEGGGVNERGVNGVQLVQTGGLVLCVVLFTCSVDPVSAELLCKVLEAIFLHEVHTQSKVSVCVCGGRRRKMGIHEPAVCCQCISHTHTHCGPTSLL